MRLLEAFKRPALAVVGLPAASRPDRARLRAAIAVRGAAQQAVVDARQTLERLQAVIQVSDDAAIVAADAQQRAKEARKAWVRDGCLSNAREHQTLAAAAAEAASAAQSATQDADAVRNELARAEDAVRVKEARIGSCDLEIRAAIGEILVFEASPLLERFERAAEEYRTLRAEVLCLEKLFATPQYEARQAVNQRVIYATLERATIKSWDRERENPRASDSLNGTHHEQDWLDRLTAPWRARAAQLREDPES
jgi:hypothetical protein